MNNNVISKIVADLWRQETSEVKAIYAAKAEGEKQAHMLKYPGYKYQPRKSAKRVAAAAIRKSPAKSSKKAKTQASASAVEPNDESMPPMVMDHHHQHHHPAIPAELESFWASNPEYQSPEGAVYDWHQAMDYNSHPPYNHPSHFPHHLQEPQSAPGGYYAYPDYHNNFSDAYLMPPQEP